VAWSDGDEKQHPRFIETVPRRGYRFIAEVTEASKANISENGAGRAVALPAAEQRDTRRLGSKHLGCWSLQP